MRGSGRLGTVGLLGGVWGAVWAHAPCTCYLECLLLGDWLDGEWGRISRTAASKPCILSLVVASAASSMHDASTIGLGWGDGNVLTWSFGTCWRQSNKNLVTGQPKRGLREVG